MSELTLLVEEMVSDLRRCSFDHLNNLPARKDDQVKGYSFATWKDTFSPDTVRIVVQGYEGKCFGIGKMYARGFRKTRSSEIKELTEDELFEFS